MTLVDGYGYVPILFWFCFHI